MTRTPPREQGSVLVPVIVALVLLSLAGAALTELFAAQRLSSVDTRESKRSFWTSEAGLWHATLDPTGISGPVAFAGSTYEVVAVGDELEVRATTADIVHEQTTSVLKSLVEADGDHPLDTAASSGSTYQHQDEHFHVALVSASKADAVLDQFAIAATGSLPIVDSLRFGGEELLPGGLTFGVPAGPFAITHVGAAVRTVPAGGSLDIRLGFASAPRAERHDLTIYFGFTDGSFAAIPVSVTW